MLVIGAMNLCECGCSQQTKWNKQKKCYNRFVNGHNGRCHPEEVLLKMRINNRGIDGDKNPMWNKHHTEKSKRLIGVAQKGNTHGFQKGIVPSNVFKKGHRPSIKSSRGIHSICDAGYGVSSSYERKFSDGMHAFNIEHIYEPERFYFKGGLSYLPDYLIVKLNLYIELKGYMDRKSKIRHELFRRQGHKLLVLGERFFQKDELYKQVLQRMLS